MKPTALTAGLLATGIALGPAAPATADDHDGTVRLDWVSSAPTAPYDEELSYPVAVELETDEADSITYFDPSGRAPDAPDVSVRWASGGEARTVQIDLSNITDFQTGDDLSTRLGTKFTDGALIDSDAGGVVVPAENLTFSGSVIEIENPFIGLECDDLLDVSASGGDAQVVVAMLATNRAQYRVQISVPFSRRTADLKACTHTPSVTPAASAEAASSAPRARDVSGAGSSTRFVAPLLLIVVILLAVMTWSMLRHSRAKPPVSNDIDREAGDDRA